MHVVEDWLSHLDFSLSNEIRSPVYISIKERLLAGAAQTSRNILTRRFSGFSPFVAFCFLFTSWPSPFVSGFFPSLFKTRAVSDSGLDKANLCFLFNRTHAARKAERRSMKIKSYFFLPLRVKANCWPCLELQKGLNGTHNIPWNTCC